MRLESVIHNNLVSAGVPGHLDRQRVFQLDPHMKRAASSRAHEKRQAVRMKLDKVFQATVDIGIGETVMAAAGQPSLHKFTLGRLSQGAFSWRQNRVPLHVFGTHAITSPVVVETTSVQEGCNTEVVKAATEVSSPSTQVNTVLWRTSSHGRRLCCKLQLSAVTPTDDLALGESRAGEKTDIQQTFRSLSTEVLGMPILSDSKLSKHLKISAEYQACRCNFTRHPVRRQNLLFTVWQCTEFPNCPCRFESRNFTSSAITAVTTLLVTRVRQHLQRR